MAGARRNRASLPGRDGRRAGYRSGWRGEKQQARIYRGGSRTLLLRADDRIAGGRERIFFHAHCGQVCWGAGWIEFAAGGGGDVRRDFLCREPADSRDCGADCVGRAEAEYFWNGDWLWIEAGGGGVGDWRGAGGGAFAISGDFAGEFWGFGSAGLCFGVVAFGDCGGARLLRAGAAGCARGSDGYVAVPVGRCVSYTSFLSEFRFTTGQSGAGASWRAAYEDFFVRGCVGVFVLWICGVRAGRCWQRYGY